jgi:NitT/TauT family transport system substrate-binding protein
MAVVLNTGCDGGDKGDVAVGTTEKVRMATGLGSFGRESPAWVAKEKGFFTKHGIEIEIQPGAAGATNLQWLASDQVQFAIIDYAGAVDRAGKGKFADYRLIGAVNYNTLIAIMAYADKVISPKDLEGKTIGQAIGAVPKTFFPTYARLAKIDYNKIKWQETSKDALIPNLAGNKLDAIGQFVTGVPAVRNADPSRPLTVLPYSKYVVDLYGNVLVTTAKRANERPDLVRSFVAAYMEGVQYAVDHPAEAAAILGKEVPSQDKAVAQAEIEGLKSYVANPDGLGVMTPLRVKKGIELMQGVQQIPENDLAPEDFVDFSVFGEDM